MSWDNSFSHTAFAPLVTGYLGMWPVDPVPRKPGQWWYNTTEKVYKYYDGASVKNIGGAGGGGVYIGPTPPPNPEKGTLWWDTTEEKLKVYES